MNGLRIKHNIHLDLIKMSLVFLKKYSSASANWQNTCSELFKSQE
jgi:hypothetical protein